MSKPKVYIRADGNPEMGLGHLVRCMALAHMLKNDFNIYFVCLEIPEKIKEVIAKNEYVLLKTEDAFFSELLNKKEIVVLDGYHFNTEYQKKIKNTGAYLVCIDDLHDKEFVADLIINHIPGIKPSDYKAQSFTKFALGFGHALLRPSFLAQAAMVRDTKETEVLMICFGGSDYKNLTVKVLEQLVMFDHFKKIIVVTGLAYNYKNSLEKFLNTDNRIVHYHAADENTMLQIMQQTDIAIVPASGILFEALAVGCKVVFGYYAENQKYFSDYLSNLLSSKICLDDIAENITKLENAINYSITNDIGEMSTIRNLISQSSSNNLRAFKNIVE